MKLPLPLLALGTALLFAIPPSTPAQETAAPAIWNPQTGEIQLYGIVRGFDAAQNTLDVAISTRFAQGAAQRLPQTPQKISVPPEASLGILLPASDDKTPQTIARTALTTGRRVLVMGRAGGDSFTARVVLILEGGTAQGEGGEPKVAGDFTAPGKIAPGWPQTVAGNVTASPVAAQLDGQGPLEIVAPVMADRRNRAASEAPAQLFAFGADGKGVAGWPVVMQTRESYAKDTMAGAWFGSPSVADLDNDGADEIVMPMPGHTDRAIKIFFGDGEKWPFPLPQQQPDCWISLPLADIDGDGVLDMVSGGVLTNTLGKEPKTWPAQRRFPYGYQSAIGDADGDGDLEVFHPWLEKDWNKPDQPLMNSVEGFDHTGKTLRGWPQKVGYIATYMMMGDITGDAAKEIVAIDWAGSLHVWTLNGEGVAGSRDLGAKGGRGIVETGLSGHFPPSLADLNGDGKAEIIVWDTKINAIRAFTGDVKGGVTGLGDPRGVIARLPRPSGRGLGIAVADLGGDGVMDLFAGPFWIRTKAGAPAQIANILGENAPIGVSPSIVDLEKDGQAEILLGGSDGRIWVYKTEQKLEPQWLQWATVSGSFRHTSDWNPAPPK
jgi:hypothetical protein